jgi:hypothetical protein
MGANKRGKLPSLISPILTKTKFYNNAKVKY